MGNAMAHCSDGKPQGLMSLAFPIHPCVSLFVVAAVLLLNFLSSWLRTIAVTVKNIRLCLRVVIVAIQLSMWVEGTIAAAAAAVKTMGKSFIAKVVPKNIAARNKDKQSKGIRSRMKDSKVMLISLLTLVADQKMRWW